MHLNLTEIHLFAHVTHKIPQFDWLLSAEVVPIKRSPLEADPIQCGTQHVQHHSELKFKSVKMPKAPNKSRVGEDNDTPLHGAINEAEAECHRQKLHQTIIDLKTSTTEPNIREIMGDFILSTKTCCEEVYPPQKCGRTESFTFHGRSLWPSDL